MSTGFKPNVYLIIVGIILASGAGYVFGQSPISGLRGENVVLQSQVDQLTDSNNDILERLEGVSEDLSETQDAFESLLSTYNHLSEVLSSTQSELQNLVSSFEALEYQFVEAQANNSYLLGLYSRVWEKYADLITAYNELTTAEPIGEMIFTEIMGVTNGEFDEGGGWVKQGKGGQGPPYADLWQYPSSTYLMQSVHFSSKDQGVIFKFKPSPYGADVSLRFSIGGIDVFRETFSGTNENYDWEEVVIPFKPIYDLKELYGFSGEGTYELRFTVEAGEDNGAHIMLDDVSLVEIEYRPEEPASNQTVSAAPYINGYVEVGEWADFQESTLEYWITYNHSIRSDSSAWDTNDKTMTSSILLDDTQLYACFLIPDDYLSEEFQIRSLFLYINGYPETTVRWTSQDEYRSNSWATYGANAQYSHSGDGMLGADGIYTIELSYPIGDLDVNEVSIQYAEVTRYTAQGFNEMSSYWVSDSLSITPVDGTQ